MIYELNKTDYDKVYPLFARLAAYLTFCAAVLEGTQAGRVFVDDAAEPRSAFMITRDIWGYLAGDPHNDTFNRALNKAIFTRQVVAEEAFGLLLHCHPEGWQKSLRVVAHPRQPISTARRRYIGRKLRFDWQANIPDGFTIQWADHTLLDHPGLEIPSDVKNVLETRGPDGDPMQKGFGFVASREDGAAGTSSIVAHAVIDSIAGGVGDIGLVTAEDFRRRGLATATAAAAVAYGLSHGLTMVNWDCGASNVGSLRTAEKLGFERERDHTMYLVHFDETWHLVNLAWHNLEAERYQEAHVVCDQIITKQDDPPSYAYLAAARVCAGLGDRDKAFGYLNIAVDKGWSNLADIQSYREFEKYHNTLTWESALERIQQNTQKQDTD